MKAVVCGACLMALIFAVGALETGDRLMLLSAGLWLCGALWVRFAHDG